MLPSVRFALHYEIALMALEAVVVEEDTHLMLSAPTVAFESYEPPKASLSHAEQTFAKEPGHVFVAENFVPVRMVAVVYDFDQEEIFREEWVASALRDVIAECRARDFKRVCIPVLGSRFGAMVRARFAELLQSALSDSGGGNLEEVVIELPIPLDASRQA